MKSLFLVSLATFLSGVAGRTFTMFTDLNVAPNVPNFPTGWSAGSFTKVSFTVPDNWKAGRIWARRDCDFSTNPVLILAWTEDGVPPATVAEWTLQGDGNLDYYDGPAQLKGPFDSTGFPVGCKSACVANLDGNQGVAFYSYFKSNCPNAYAYAFDESSGTALWTCNSSLNADYTVTFCPPP
ncbi:thaumatin [Flammula alnicola]|nr:thaumatin [Flammula alnicola]